MSSNQQIITGHFIAHWGVPREIRPRKVQGIEKFAILEFGPRGSRTTWLYATNGMSSYAQAYPDDHMKICTELYACCKQRVTWVDDLLAAIATYPRDCTTYLAEADTIEVGQPIDRNSSGYTGILLAPPYPPTLGLVGSLSENVLVHKVVGLLPAEVQFAERHGGRVLLEKLTKYGELGLDESRVPVV
jgi:hypothetical protein